MSKQKFFIDMDGTITNTIKAYCQTYNVLYYYHPKFKPADYNKVNAYNFSDQCPLVMDVQEIFNHLYMEKINGITFTFVSNNEVLDTKVNSNKSHYLCL